MNKTRLLRQAINNQRAEAIQQIDSLLLPKSTADSLKRSSVLFDEKIDAIRERWRAFYVRSEIYTDNEHYQKYNLRWSLSRTIDSNLRRIEQSVYALKELYRLAHENNLGELNYRDAEETLLNIIEFSIKRIELKQSLLLLKYQGIARNRDHLIDLAQSIRSLNTEIRSKINKHKYFELDLPEHLHNVFNKFKLKKLRFENVSKKLDIVSDTRRAAVSTYSTFSTLQNQYPYLINIAQTTSSVLSSIPILSSIGSIIPPLISTIKNWYQRRSNWKIALSIVMLALAVTGAIVAGVVATAVAAAIVAASLVAAGIIHEHLIPLIQLNRKIKLFQREHDAIDAKIQTINGILTRNAMQKQPLDPRQMAPLDLSDKHALIRKLEDYYSQHPDQYSRNELLITRTQISRGNFKELMNNKFLTKALSGVSLANFLINSAKERKQYLAQEIKATKKKRTLGLINMLNAGVSLVGAIMACIPFPPVIVVGVVLIALSTINAIAIKYNWYQRFGNFVSNLFTPNKNNVSVDTTQPAPANQPKANQSVEKTESAEQTERRVKGALYSSSTSKSSVSPPTQKKIPTPAPTPTQSSSTSKSSDKKESLHGTTTIFTPRQNPATPSSNSEDSVDTKKQKPTAKPGSKPSSSES